MCALLYQIGGSQAYDAPSYVVRKADMEDLKELSQSELIWVRKSKIRQSSLKQYRYAYRRRHERLKSVLPHSRASQMRFDCFAACGGAGRTPL